MWRALVWLNIYGREAVRHKLKNRQKMRFFVFLGCFCPYVRQPHRHIGWVPSMPSASFNPTNPRTNPWNFWKKILRIGGIENYFFFWVSHFCFILMKISHKLCDRMDGTQFWCFPCKFLAMRNITLYSVTNLKSKFWLIYVYHS